MDNNTKLAIEREQCPKWAEHQLNGKSAMENYITQKEKIMNDLVDSDDYTVNIKSELKIK